MSIGYHRQLLLFLKKNFLMRFRSPMSLISQFVLAFGVLLIVLFFDHTLVEQPLYTDNTKAKDIQLQQCPDFMGGNCVDLYIYNNDVNNTLYTPSDVEELYQQFTTAYPNKNIKMITETVLSDKTIEEFLYDESLDYITLIIIHPLTYDENYLDSTPSIIKYAVIPNPHLSGERWDKAYIPFAWRTHQQIISKVANENIEIDFNFERFPNNKDTTLSAQMFSDGSSAILFIMILVNFIAFLNHIVAEKENGQRLYMKMVGAYDSMYWVALFIENMFITFFLSWFIVFVGYVFGFRLMTLANVFSLFLCLWTFSFSMTCFAFFVSTLINRTRVAITLSVGFFIVGLIFQQISETAFMVNAIFDNLAYIYIVVLGIFPPFFFGVSISAFTYYYDTGLEWSNMTEDIPDTNVFGPAYALLLLFGVGLLWIVVGTLLLITSESENGWLYEVFGYKALKQLAKYAIATDDEDETENDEDVEEEKRLTLEESNNLPMRLYDVRKTFYNRYPYKTVDDVSAVRGVTLSVDNGTVFCLLGHNGAGKSTLIKLITGQHVPTHGRIIMGGIDLAHDLAYVRQNVGLCPQHDVVFPNLTAREHLRFYGKLKGLNGYLLEKEIQHLLELVSLENAADKHAENFSGGMKRRLSVAIACVASPRCIILDEPTTGMDPVSRREVWGVIEKIKAGKTVLMTTHYMDEAEVLSDKIAIMSNGKVQCIGSSIHLKSKYGTGYVLTVNTDLNDVDKVKQQVLDIVPTARIIQTVSGKIKFGINYSQSDDLLTLLKRLEDKQIDVVNWGVSPSNLEEVFLSCTGLDYKQMDTSDDQGIPLEQIPSHNTKLSPGDINVSGDVDSDNSVNNNNTNVPLNRSTIQPTPVASSGDSTDVLLQNNPNIKITTGISPQQDTLDVALSTSSTHSEQTSSSSESTESSN
ncbi:ABC transporter [Entamoeba marina]